MVFEIDPYYVDVIIRRFKQVYGVDAIQADSKLDFEELRAERSGAGGKKRGKKSSGKSEKVRPTKARP